MVIDFCCIESRYVTFSKWLIRVISGLILVESLSLSDRITSKQTVSRCKYHWRYVVITATLQHDIVMYAMWEQSATFPYSITVRTSATFSIVSLGHVLFVCPSYRPPRSLRVVNLAGCLAPLSTDVFGAKIGSLYVITAYWTVVLWNRN